MSCLLLIGRIHLAKLDRLHWHLSTWYARFLQFSRVADQHRFHHGKTLHGLIGFYIGTMEVFEIPKTLKYILNPMESQSEKQMFDRFLTKPLHINLTLLYPTIVVKVFLSVIVSHFWTTKMISTCRFLSSFPFSTRCRLVLCLHTSLQPFQLAEDKCSSFWRSLTLTWLPSSKRLCRYYWLSMSRLLR